MAYATTPTRQQEIERGELLALTLYLTRDSKDATRLRTAYGSQSPLTLYRLIRSIVLAGREPLPRKERR